MKSKTVIFHPFLFAVYPWVFLYAINFGDVPLVNIAQAGAGTFCLSGILLWVLGNLTKQLEKSSLIVSGTLLLFFFYGHIHEYLFIEHKISLGRHRYLLSLWGLLFGLLLLLTWHIKKCPSSLIRFLNLASLVLSVGSVIILVMRVSAYSDAKDQFSPSILSQLQQELRAAPAKESYPDIYYIVLDGYARQDTLTDLYHYPDNDLESYLRTKGFYIASKSMANYAHTFLSLASSLNMSHLLELSKTPGQDSAIKKIPFAMIENNEVVRFLKSRGFTYIHFSSGYEVTQTNRLADKTVNCYPTESNRVIGLLLQTTLLSAIEPRFPYHWFYNNHEEGAKRLCELSGITTSLAIQGPKFTFLHILLPHPPYLFRQDGTVYEDAFTMASDSWNDRNKYKEQLIFLNQQIKIVVDQILAQSSKPPIIIIQGDHGPASTVDFDHPTPQGLNERMRILNAYLLPEDGSKDLYDSITPINSFRVIFNRYFGTSLKRESDSSYFSSWVLPYKFLDVSTTKYTELSLAKPTKNFKE